MPTNVKTLGDSSQTQNPSLWMVIFDRDLQLREALELDYATMIIVDANADDFVNLETVYLKPIGSNPYYQYSTCATFNIRVSVANIDSSHFSFYKPKP